MSEVDPVIDSLFVILDHAAWNIHSSFVELLHLLLYISVSSILQFLGNVLRSILGEDGSSSPIHSISVCSHAELDLPIDELPVIVVSQIQALVATRLINVLNFFAPNSGSPCRTQSGIIFSELIFHQEQLVGPFVPCLLGDIVHENKILCESEENDS